MRYSDHIRHALIRGAVLIAVVVCVWLLRGLPPEEPAVTGALISMAVVLVLGLVPPARVMRAPVQLGLLSADLIALAVIGCILVDSSIPGADARVPFLCGYLVATLVAVVGHRLAAAALGALGGTMVLIVGTMLIVDGRETLQPVLMGVQVVFVGLAALLTTGIAGGVKREARRRELRRTVDAEMKSREAAASELVSFTQALADSNTLEDIGAAVLRHLSRHTEMAVRALVLESQHDEVGLWEEPGRLDAERVERRRLRLQESLARVGSSHILEKLKCRSSGMGDTTDSSSYRTVVDIPLQIGDRVAGVLFLADPRSAALPPERVGSLVDVARRTGEAVSRLQRLRDHENRRTAILLHQMREGVLLLGGEGQVLLANVSARKMLRGNANAEIDPDLVPKIGDLTLEELSQTPPGISRRFRATIHRDEFDHPTQLACTAISVLDHGRRIGTLVTLSDITEEELTRSRIIQSEKMTLVGQTLAGVAHELNNPLAAH